MKKIVLFCGLLALLFALPCLAQEEREVARKEQGEAVQQGDLHRVLELPKRTQEAREAGIPEQDVREVLEAAKQHQLSPGETDELLAESAKAARENGNVDNFGAFVKSKMAEGMRGKDLANAIHAEHKVRGKGRGQGVGKGKAHQEKEQHKGESQKNQEQEKHLEGQGKGQGQEKSPQDKPQDDQGKGAAKGGKKGKGGGQ